MRLTKTVAFAAACAVIGAAFGAAPAEAAKKQRYSYVQRDPGTIVTFRDESGRTRTRVVVTRRSYLDGGTEVLPGERKYTDYVIPPYYSPLDVLGPGKNYDRQPLNAPWESGGVRGFW